MSKYLPYQIKSINLKKICLSTTNQGLNSILSGFVNDQSWKFGSFDNQLQNNLFFNAQGINQKIVDLLATNINRGRDHGLQSYVNYVKKCSNIIINSFQDLQVLMNQNAINSLQAVYS